jgi:hypothetical protein
MPRYRDQHPANIRCSRAKIKQEISAAKAIFAAGKSPTAIVETLDSSAAFRRIYQPASPKTEATNQTTAERGCYAVGR